MTSIELKLFFLLLLHLFHKISYLSPISVNVCTRMQHKIFLFNLFEVLSISLSFISSLHLFIVKITLKWVSFGLMTTFCLEFFKPFITKLTFILPIINTFSLVWLKKTFWESWRAVDRLSLRFILRISCWNCLVW